MSACLVKDPLAINVATALLATGARTPLVEALTGLSGAAVRKIAKSLGIPPSGKGPMPEGAASFISKRHLHASASLFADCFDTFRRNRNAIDAEDLIRCHTTYLSILPDALPGIDINHAWIVARDLHARIVALEDCPACGARYFWGKGMEIHTGCPVCTLSSRTGSSFQRPWKRRSPYLTDEQWAAIEPLVAMAARRQNVGRPRTKDRDVLEALMWAARNRRPLRSLPDGYPCQKTCLRRLAEWEDMGVLDRIIGILGEGELAVHVRRFLAA